jgi:hypothetical protein
MGQLLEFYLSQGRKDSLQFWPSALLPVSFAGHSGTLT